MGNKPILRDTDLVSNYNQRKMNDFSAIEYLNAPLKIFICSIYATDYHQLPKGIQGILPHKLLSFRVTLSNQAIQIPKPYDPPSIVEDKILCKHKNKNYRLIMLKQES